MSDSTIPTEDAELRQHLAAIEHERWANWQKWCHKILRQELNPNRTNNDLEDVLRRWDKQIATPYSELSDKEKASDMEQVDRYWPLIQSRLDDAYKKGYVDAQLEQQRQAGL